MGGYAYIPMSKEIYWIKTARRNSLSGRVRIRPFDNAHDFSVGLNESDIDPIQKWCQENNCGIRTSFDTFKFKNKKEITLFLLKWGS